MNGGRREVAQLQKDGGQFVPHPTTWLNQRRWEDEVDTIPKVQNVDRLAIEKQLEYAIDRSQYITGGELKAIKQTICHLQEQLSK